MERLGIGWARLHDANPRLVHTSITGFGLTGPLATLPGFDPVFQARSGLMAAQGGSDEPVLHLIAYNDYCAGALGALATVAALVARERTGHGQHVDVSLLRTAFIAQAAEMSSTVAGGRDYLGPSAVRRLYACRDGWLCVAATTPPAIETLGQLARVMLAPDEPVEGPGAEAVTAFLNPLDRADALARLAAAGVPAAPCLTFDEVFADPFLRSAHLTTQDHPTLGRLELPAPFIRFSATPIIYCRSAPDLGADSRDVLREIGYDNSRIDALIAAGVMGPPAK